MQSYPCNRPWRPVGLWNAEDLTLSRRIPLFSEIEGLVIPCSALHRVKVQTQAYVPPDATMTNYTKKNSVGTENIHLEYLEILDENKFVEFSKV
jgi:hypothetical protein